MKNKSINRLVINYLFIIISTLFITCTPEHDEIDIPELPENPELIALIPYDLQLKEISLTEKKLTWDFNYTNIDGFRIDRKVGDENWKVAYLSVSKDQYFAVDNEVVPDSTLLYKYRVYAWSGASVSLFSAIERKFSINPPENFKIEYVNDIIVKLSWDDKSNGETGFKIDKKLDNSNWVNAFATTDANMTDYYDTLVDKSINLSYRVYAAWNDLGSEKLNESTSFSLEAPNIVSSSPISFSQNKINWIDMTDGEEGFIIDRKVDDGDWEEAYAILPANEQSYIDDNFPCNSSVEYRVCAFVGNVESDKVSTTIENYISTPYNLNIVMEDLSDIRIVWNDQNFNEAGFRVDRKIENSTWEENWKLVGSGVNECHDNNFPIDKEIQYKVFAKYSDCTSTSVSGDIETNIPDITYFNLSLTNDNKIKLSWGGQNINGEEGFKIDRKRENSDWEIAYASTDPNVNIYYDDTQYELGENVKYRVYAYYQNYVSEYLENSILYCTGIVVDSRDGQEYEVLYIGNQCWFKENLNVGSRINGSQEMSNNSIIEKYCYDNIEGNCSTYGGLYQWNEMMQYTTEEGAQGICPDGWHIPTYAEWTIVTDYLGGVYVAGGKMKETGTTHWYSPNTGATNSSGFTGLPGGHRYNSVSFRYLGERGDWWSSTETSGMWAWFLNLRYKYDTVHWTPHDKTGGRSVRCLKN